MGCVVVLRTLASVFDVCVELAPEKARRSLASRQRFTRFKVFVRLSAHNVLENHLKSGCSFSAGCRERHLNKHHFVVCKYFLRRSATSLRGLERWRNDYVQGSESDGSRTRTRTNTRAATCPGVFPRTRVTSSAEQTYRTMLWATKTNR